MTQFKSSMQRFASDQRGGLSNLMLPLFLLLILTTGWAIDLILHDTERADLQDALDRGVLAAASTSQGQDRQTVIQDYVDKRPFARDDEQEADHDTKPWVVLPQNINNTESSKIEAHAKYDFPTVFANIVFHDSYPVPAVTTAEEGVAHVELSLVLDISASMAQNDVFDAGSGQTKRRLVVLQDAAKNFVSDLLGGGTRQRVSISLVPYSGQVNAGPFFDHLLQGTRDHEDSSCIDFLDTDFGFIGLPQANSRQQTPQFNFFVYSGDFVEDGTSYNGPDNNEWGWCPRNSRKIVPLSRDVVKLQDAIDDFAGHDGTGTQIGMKWATALLDPSTQPLIQALSLDTENTGVPADFGDRPFPYGQGGVLKYIVLMTDGNIRYQPRPKPEELDTENERLQWAEAGRQTIPVEDDEDPRYYSAFGAYYPGNVMFRHRDRLVVGDNASLNLDEQLRTQQFLALCDLARNKGIRIFTIAYDVSETSDAYAEMNQCAKSPEEIALNNPDAEAADFFHVEDGNLQAVLDQIVDLVFSLRLTK